MSRRSRIRICVYGTLGVLVLLLLLHPYAWQTVFGPRIRRMPLAYWQDQYRHAVAPAHHGSLATRLFIMLRVKPPIQLSELNDSEDMIPVVLSLTADPNWSVRKAVARGLAKHGENSEACNGVMRLTEDGSPDIRGHAIASLTSIGGRFEPALPRLQELMRDDDPICRVKAAAGVCCVSKQPDIEAIKIFRSALETEDWNGYPSVCLETAHQLCKLGKDNPDFLKLLASRLSTDAKLRTQFAFLMREAGSAATPVLMELLEDGFSESRVVAISGLGWVGPGATEAIPALVRLLDEGDESMRSRAVWALRRIDPVQFPTPGQPPVKLMAKPK
jgi:HEAT repeat protein